MNYDNNSNLISFLRRSLNEDIGKRDITTEIIIPPDRSVRAILLAKEDAVVCGLDIAGLVFKLKNKKIKFKPLIRDGQKIKKGEILACIKGKAKSILTAERVALNFLNLLSGIATRTRQYVDKIRPYKVKIMDTRKTIPGLRQLQKYAVRVGGGYNHRMRLDEMVLIKDNHLKVSGGYQKLQKLPKVTRGYGVELEVKNLKEFKEALKLKPDIIMLDNMSVKDIKKAVNLRNYQLPITNYQLPKLEASGRINLKNISKIASTGIDTISIGELTHSINSVDISLEIL